jgi:decaprenyl-phosphate phosphoribosyltransferase
MEFLRLVFSLLRVNQWVKNILVFAAPAGAGVLFETESLQATLLAFVAFSFTASALYIVNDIIDMEGDRRHPRKMSRPIASGRVSVPVAVVVAVALLLGSAVVAGLFLPAGFWVVLMAYVANTILYTWWGKHVPIVDVMQVALGFVLRAVAGAEATVVPLSQWFMAAAMFGSLLMVAGKRSSELAHVSDEGTTRSVLRSYTTDYLRQIMVISAAALLLTYAMWALSDTEAPIMDPWALISFAPFVYSVFRYMYLSDTGDAEQPERLVFVDRGLQLGALTWVATIGIGIYA